MAQKIDPSKLLPSAKTSSALVPFKTSSIALPSKKSNVDSAIKPVQSKIGSALVKRKEGDEKKEAEDVNNKLKLIEGVFKSELSVFRKKTEVKREDKEKKDFEDAEKKLETPKTRQFKFPSISIPKLGFMDRVNRFLFFTALGWLFPRILELIPKLEEFGKKLKSIGKFFGFIFEKLHDGFESLVKFGSGLKDKTLGFIKDIPGAQEFGQKFSELEKQFSLFTDVAIVASVLAGDIGLTVADELNKLRKEGKPPEGKPKGGKPPTTKPKGKISPHVGSEGPTVKPKAPSFWDKILKGPFAKLKGPLSKFGAAVIPGIGAVAGAADAYARFQAGDKVGGTLASISAGLDGISVVLALTGIGAPVAAALGTISMSIDALLLIRDIVKAFFPYVPMFAKGGRVVRKYQGGGTTRGGTSTNRPIRRSIKPQKIKPQKIKPQKSTPGKDVGGETNIKRLYPSPEQNKIMSLNEWLATDSAGTYSEYVERAKVTIATEKPKANPYKVLTTASEKFKQLPMGLGNIVGAAIDSSLGQRVDIRAAVKQFSSGLNYLFETYMSRNGKISTTSMSRDINSFADGGFVPFSDQPQGLRNSMNFGQMISKILEPEINSKISDILDTVKNEVRKKGVSSGNEENGPAGPGGDGGDGPPTTVTGGNSDFWALVAIAALENGDSPQGMADVAQSIYNRVAAGNAGVRFGQTQNTILGQIIAPGQYSPVHESNKSLWTLITDKQSAIAAVESHPNGRGRGERLVNAASSAITNPQLQQNAANWVQGRTDFAATGYVNPYPGGFGYINRNGHVFGWFVGGGSITYGKSNPQPAVVPSLGNVVIMPNVSTVPGGTVNARTPILVKLSDVNRLETKDPGLCTTAVILSLQKNGMVVAPGGTADDASNPRSLIIQLVKNHGWTSLPGVGHSFTLRGRNERGTGSGRYGNVNVNVMSYSEYVSAVRSNLVPSGALVFQTRHRDWNVPSCHSSSSEGSDGGCTSGSSGFDSAIAINGGRNLFNGELKRSTSIYGGNVKQVIVLVPRNSISATSSSTSSSTLPSIPQLPPPPAQNTPGQNTPGQGGRVSIYSGHADMLRARNSGPVRTTAEQIQFGTNGGVGRVLDSNYYTNEAFINDLVARRVAQKASNVATYRQPIRVERGRQQGSNWERAKEDILRNRITPFEIHHDQPAGSGGLLMDNYRSRLSNRYIKALNDAYGPHANPGNRSKLGFQVYGGAILEVSALTPEILKNRSTINNHVNRESTRIASALQNAARMKGGGPVDTKSISSYTDYSYGSRGSIAVQRIIIRQPVPVPLRSSGDMIMFPVPVAVNSNTDTEYNRSRGY